MYTHSKYDYMWGQLTDAQKYCLIQMRQDIAEDSRRAEEKKAKFERQSAAEEKAWLLEQLEQVAVRDERLFIQNQFVILVSLLNRPEFSMPAEFLASDKRYYPVESHEAYIAKLGQFLKRASWRIRGQVTWQHSTKVGVDIRLDDESQITCYIPPEYWLADKNGEILDVMCFGYDGINEMRAEICKAVLPQLAKYPQISRSTKCNFVKLLFVSASKKSGKYTVKSPQCATHVLIALDYDSTYTSSGAWRRLVAEAARGIDCAELSAEEIINFFYSEADQEEFQPEIIGNSKLRDGVPVVIRVKWEPAKLMPELDLTMECGPMLNHYRHALLRQFCTQTFDCYLRTGEWC